MHPTKYKVIGAIKGYNVIEISTDIIVTHGDTMQEAGRAAKLLNKRGVGFKGFTPKFMEIQI